MFCRFCGQKIADESVFCSYCGRELETISCNNVTSSSVIAKKDERKGYSIYFNDICRLEFIFKYLSDKAEELKKDIEGYKEIRYMYWDYSYDHKNMFYGNGVRFIFGYDGNDYYFYVQSKIRDSTDCDGLPYTLWNQYFPEINFKEEHKLTVERLQKIRKIETRIEEGWFRSKEIPIRWNCDSSEFHSGKTWFAPDWLDTFENHYERAQKDLPKWYVEAQENAEKCEAELDTINEEMNSVRYLLEKEYSLNIIPNKFRNLETIWYICDYYDSSDESLKEILLHLDLDAIKMKLDAVIANQQKIIINQAIEIAQNKTLIAQNQEVLSRLSAIEQQSNIIAQNTAQTAQNTADTAQWAKIAANNAEACAWISVANYIKWE